MGKYDNYFKNFNDMVAEELEKPLVLYYPSVQQYCNNCVISQINDAVVSLGKYNQTGPQPFNGTVCPVCFGNPTISVSKSESIMGRFYYKLQNYKGTKYEIIPDGGFLFITSVENITKLKSCSYAVPDNAIDGLDVERFYLKKNILEDNFSMNPKRYIDSYWAKQ